MTGGLQEAELHSRQSLELSSTFQHFDSDCIAVVASNITTKPHRRKITRTESGDHLVTLPKDVIVGNGTFFWKLLFEVGTRWASATCPW
jgi:hypothetical protein